MILEKAQSELIEFRRRKQTSTSHPKQKGTLQLCDLGGGRPQVCLN